jgi:hypothetical protein
LDIAHQRLHTQHIAGTLLEKPEDVVRWLGAVQAQDYPAAKWALGLRFQHAKDSDVEQAFTDGTILRTHVMRPTWHFVLPDDIRWLLALTAPRVNALNAHYYRKLELDAATLTRSSDVLAKALQGGKQLTRLELGAMLQQAGIDTHDALRLGYIIMHAELDAIVCSGPRRGKQFTYALLDERAPGARTLEHDEALAELTLRYFTGHGPATLKDYMWWSGLSAADARAGLEMVNPQLLHEVVDDKTYWLAESAPIVRGISPTAYLLPNFDEYGIGYKDRSALLETSPIERLDAGDIYFGHMIIIDGQLVGAWKRTFSKDAVVISVQTFTKLTDAESRAIATAANRYGAFLGMPVTLS